MASTASRSRRPRPAADTDDVLFARAVEFSDWARRNARIVIGVVVLAFLIVGGLLYYRVYRADRRELASTEFLQVQQTLASGNRALAARDLASFVRRFEGAPAATEARLILAQLHLETGKPREAIAALDDAAGDIGGSPFGAQAAMLLAAAQSQAGNPEAAIATYRRVADAASLEYQRQEALSDAALLLTQQGRFADAAEVYRQLAEAAEEGSVERSIFQMRLAEAEGRALAR